MDAIIALMLGQDGLTAGAIYALLAIALVLVFAVTRVIFIPQGDFVALSALTIATLQVGQLPGTLWLLLATGAVTAVVDGQAAWRRRRFGEWPRIAGWNLAYPALLALAFVALPPAGQPVWLQMLFTLALVAPLGPMIYRLAYQPVAETSTLVLLIVSVAVHFVMVGLCLFFFGAEGLRAQAYSDFSAPLGVLTITGQSLWVLGVSVLLIGGLYLYFGRSVYGKALTATAFNRTGARLMGISPARAGRQSFLLAALIGAVSGLLIAPLTTVYYDTGFLVSLKGFVGAIVGGLASYPLAAGGALLVGLIEAFASFWASAFKEIIVFMMIIPVLLWLSLRSPHVEEDE